MLISKTQSSQIFTHDNSKHNLNKWGGKLVKTQFFHLGSMIVTFFAKGFDLESHIFSLLNL